MIKKDNKFILFIFLFHFIIISSFISSNNWQDNSKQDFDLKTASDNYLFNGKEYNLLLPLI